jgi:hypothetical protein
MKDTHVQWVIGPTIHLEERMWLLGLGFRASVLKSLCSQLFLAGYLALFGNCDLPILYVDQSLDYTSEVPHKKTNNVFCVFGDTS